MNRSLLLDFLRVFAIALVFIAHFGQVLDHSAGSFFGVKNFYYVSLGGLGVSLFLILSGVLAGLGGSSKNESYLLYMLKKVLRIYPLYLLSVPIAIVGYLLGGLLMEGDLPELFPNGFLVDLLWSITAFYSWAGMWGGPYNSPSWFIALIMVMYALFPLLFFCIKRAPHITLAVLLAVSVLSRWYIGQEGIPFIAGSLFDELKGWAYRQYGFMPGRPGDWFPLCRVFEFGLGIYIALRVPKTFWFRLQFRFTQPVRVLSDLAFPLFLIHYPFMFLVLWFAELGLHLYLSIGVYLCLLFVAAWWVNSLDNRVPRKRIIALFTTGRLTEKPD